jgi:hypothetical protein
MRLPVEMSGVAAFTTKALIRTTAGMGPFPDLQGIKIKATNEWRFTDTYRTPDALQDLS